MRTLLVLLCLARLSPASAAEYAGDAFRLGAGARSLGVGGAYVAVSDDATAVTSNPAGLTQLARPEAHAQHAERFGGTVNHDVVSLGFPTEVGVFGVGLVRVGVDGIPLTGLEDPSEPLGPGNRPVETARVGTSDYTLSVAYARVLGRLSAGAAVKAIWRNLDAGDGTGTGIDLAVHYRHDDAWRFGAVLRDATGTRISFDSGARDTVDPSLDIGVAWTHESPGLRGRLIAAGSVEVNGGDAAHAGVEYRHRRGIAARLGLDGSHFTAGAGIEPGDRVRIDVAFLENGDLDNTYRISAALRF